MRLATNSRRLRTAGAIEDRLHVVLHRALADSKIAHDLSSGVALKNQLGDLDLRRCEAMNGEADLREGRTR